MGFTLVITDDSVNVIESRTRRLQDPDTGEIIVVPADNHRSAIGLGDFTTVNEKTGEKIVDEAGFAAAVSAKVAAVCGQDLADVVADKTLATALIADAKVEAAKIIDDARKVAATASVSEEIAAESIK